MEQDNLRRKIDYNVQFSLPPMEDARKTIIALFQCPSDTGPEVAQLEFIPEPDPPPSPFGPVLLHPIPVRDKNILVSKCNYSGVFGTTGIEADLSSGNGVFFRNSRVRLMDITDGQSNTFLVGERRGDLGTVTWTGVEPLVVKSAARIVAVAEHAPGDTKQRFEDFHSAHSAGVHFVCADGSTRLISNQIATHVYHALATRSGGEAITAD